MLRVAAAFLIAGCSLAQAATADSSLRSLLREQGVEFRLGYISQTATNVQGGDRQLWRYADEWAFGATLDLEKLFGLPRSQLRVTLTDRNGRNLSNDAQLGSLQEVQGIYGRGQTWHWTQFSYSQKFLDGFLDWKIGRLVGGEDFADFPCEFMNLALCGPPPGNIAINYWYNWPVSQWGTRLRASFKGFGYVQVGVFDANQNYLRTSRGLDLGAPGGTSGVLVPVEVAWQPVIAGRLEGTYKFGAWYNSSRSESAAPERRSRAESRRIHPIHPATHCAVRGESEARHSRLPERNVRRSADRAAGQPDRRGPVLHRATGLSAGRSTWRCSRSNPREFTHHDPLALGGRRIRQRSFLPRAGGPMARSAAHCSIRPSARRCCVPSR